MFKRYDYYEDCFKLIKYYYFPNLFNNKKKIEKEKELRNS